MQAELKYVPLDALVESVDNVRKTHDPAKHAELVASIRAHGILTPLIVRPSAVKVDQFEIAAGHRRKRAGAEAGVAEVPVSVRSMDDRTFREVMLTENLQRVDPDPLDEADGYQSMIDELGYDVPTLSLKFGKSETYVRARLVLTNLCAEGRAALAAGTIELGHAVLLARTDHPQQQRLLTDTLLVSRNLPPERYRAAAKDDAWDDLSDPAPDDDYDASEQQGSKRVATDPVRTVVSVAELRDVMAQQLHPLGPVKWDKDDATLVPAAGACSTCPKRTGAALALFPELDASDERCSDGVCYAQKRTAWLTQRVAQVRSQAPNLVLLTKRSQRRLKVLDRTPVHVLDKHYKASTAKRGVVPALIVEDVHYRDEHAQWETLGTLIDVKAVPKPSPRPAEEKGSSSRGHVSIQMTPAQRQAHQRAEQRFLAATAAVLRAVLAAPAELTLPDHRDAMVLSHISEASQFEVAWNVSKMLRRVLTTDTRSAQIVAWAAATELHTPDNWYMMQLPYPEIEEATGAYAMPASLAELASAVHVDAAAVWSAALVGVPDDAIAQAKPDADDDESAADEEALDDDVGEDAGDDDTDETDDSEADAATEDA